MMKRPHFLLGVTASILSACTHTQATTAPFVTLTPDAQQFIDRFNDDASKVRILMLVSPTCGFCLRGAQQIQRTVLASVADSQLAAYVVWVPELGATSANVSGASALVPDPRAHHFWDADERLGRAYQDILPTPAAAWDVYLLFGKGQRWNAGRPPKPAFWMHQLAGVTAAPRFDATVFRDHAVGLLHT